MIVHKEIDLNQPLPPAQKEMLNKLADYYDALAAAGALAKINPGKDGLPPVKVKEKPQPWEYILSAELATMIKGQLLEQLQAGFTNPAVQNVTR